MMKDCSHLDKQTLWSWITVPGALEIQRLECPIMYLLELFQDPLQQKMVSLPTAGHLELGDIQGPFQPKPFYSSTKYHSTVIVSKIKSKKNLE